MPLKLIKLVLSSDEDVISADSSVNESSDMGFIFKQY